MGITTDKKVLQVSRITTLRETTPGGLSRKFTNMTHRYGMQRQIIPDKIAQCEYEPLRTTNAGGRPTR